MTSPFIGWGIPVKVGPRREELIMVEREKAGGAPPPPRSGSGTGLRPEMVNGGEGFRTRLGK